jgi:hypothetical protein
MKPKVGDRVRVVQSGGKLGPTVFKVKVISSDGFSCLISEINENEVECAPQPFDLSLLKTVKG